MSSARPRSQSTRKAKLARWPAPRPCAPGATRSPPTRPSRLSTAAAAGTENVLPRILACVEARVTLGEISDALRGVWGEHRP